MRRKFSFFVLNLFILSLYYQVLWLLHHFFYDKHVMKFYYYSFLPWRILINSTYSTDCTKRKQSIEMCCSFYCFLIHCKFFTVDRIYTFIRLNGEYWVILKFAGKYWTRSNWIDTFYWDICETVWLRRWWNGHKCCWCEEEQDIQLNQDFCQFISSASRYKSDWFVDFWICDNMRKSNQS